MFSKLEPVSSAINMSYKQTNEVTKNADSHTSYTWQVCILQNAKYVQIEVKVVHNSQLLAEDAFVLLSSVLLLLGVTFCRSSDIHFEDGVVVAIVIVHIKQGI